MKNIGIVIPAWNEEQDIHLVLNAVLPVEWIAQIVVVDDGSSDKTLEIAQGFMRDYPKLIVEHLPENHGKGAAMLAGLRTLPKEIETVIFIDADLVGLTEDHLKIIYEPIQKEKCEMSVAIFKKGHWRTDISQRFAPNLNGQRCLPRVAAENALELFAECGYGVEIGVTLYARQKRWRIKYVNWFGMTHKLKESKLGLIEGYRIRAIMYQQIISTWSRVWWQEKKDNWIAAKQSGD